MFQLIDDLKQKYKLKFSGDFEELTEGESKVIRSLKVKYICTSSTTFVYFCCNSF